MNKRLMPVLLVLAIPLLASCQRMIPVTVYGNMGYPCSCTELIYGATLDWEQGAYSGWIRYFGLNQRDSGFTVSIREGQSAHLSATNSCSDAGADGLCGTADDTDNEFSVESDSVVIQGNVFSSRHYYFVMYLDNIEVYYE